MSKLVSGGNKVCTNVSISKDEKRFSDRLNSLSPKGRLATNKFKEGKL